MSRAKRKRVARMKRRQQKPLLTPRESEMLFDCLFASLGVHVRFLDLEEAATDFEDPTAEVYEMAPLSLTAFYVKYWQQHAEAAANDAAAELNLASILADECEQTGDAAVPACVYERAARWQRRSAAISAAARHAHDQWIGATSQRREP